MGGFVDDCNQEILVENWVSAPSCNGDRHIVFIWNEADGYLIWGKILALTAIVRLGRRVFTLIATNCISRIILQFGALRFSVTLRTWTTWFVGGGGHGEYSVGQR